MEYSNNPLALPVATMLLLTLVVWTTLFVSRVRYMTANKLDAEQLKTPADTQSVIPAEVSGASNNFKNLFEMPVVFYVTCFYLTLFGQIDSVHVTCAWLFVFGRIAHSLIHCSYNRVMHRFLIYLLSSLVVWVMVVRAFLAAV